MANMDKIPQNTIDNMMISLAPPRVSANLPPGPLIETNKSILDLPFNMRELQLAIKSSKNTSPGIDRITYSILDQTSLTAKNKLLEIYNRWWTEGEYIDEMRQIVVCLFRKPNPQVDNEISYRPISLMPCTSKTFERMIRTRLEWYCEFNNVLPQSQYGGRKGRGTAEADRNLL